MGKHKRILTPMEIRAKKKFEAQKAELTHDQEFAQLRPLQKQLFIEILKDPGCSDVEQIRRAGYKVTENSKPQHLKKALEGKLGMTLRHFGIFEDDLAKLALDGLQATTTKIVKMQKRDKDGKVIGEELKFIEIPDYKTRHAYWLDIVKLGDYFPAKQVRHTGDVTLHAFHDVDPSVLAQRREELLAKTKEVTGDFQVVES